MLARFHQATAKFPRSEPAPSTDYHDAAAVRTGLCAISSTLSSHDSFTGDEAELAGLTTGDVIESYGDGRIFNFTDLRNSTATGERGELVPVVVRRGDLYIEAVVPRGPLGVRIEADRLPPSE